MITETLVKAGLRAADRVLEKFLPDEETRHEARKEMRLEMNREREALRESDRLQSEVNLADARSTDPMQKRWRPFIGWICGLALAVYYLLIPLVGLGMAVWYAVSTGQPFVAPEFDIGELSMLLFGLLGLGAYRSIEKVKGKA